MGKRKSKRGKAAPAAAFGPARRPVCADPTCQRCRPVPLRWCDPNCQRCAPGDGRRRCEDVYCPQCYPHGPMVPGRRRTDPQTLSSFGSGGRTGTRPTNTPQGQRVRGGLPTLGHGHR